MITTSIDIAGLEGEHITLTHAQLDTLRSRVEGPLLRAADEGWNDAVLIWNAIVAKAPALVSPAHLGPGRRRGRPVRG